MRQLFSGCAQLIKNMIVPFVRRLEDDSRLFKQIRPHRRPTYVELLVKLQLDKFPKTRAVVVPGRFRVADGLTQKPNNFPEPNRCSSVQYLHDGAAGQHFPFYLRLGGVPADCGEVSHGVFGGHRFSGAAFAGNDDALVALLSFEFRVRLFGHGEDVRVQVAHRLTSVGLNGVGA